MKTYIKGFEGNKIFYVINYMILIILMIVILYPLYFIIIASISDPTLVNTGKVVLWPGGITFAGYKRIFSNAVLWDGYGITIIYTVLGTILNLFLTLTAAYSLSRKNYLGKRFLLGFFMFTMYFGGGLIPTYLVVKDIGLYNSFFTLIVLNGISVYNLIVAKSFIEGSIPEELFESASIDGCSHIMYFERIVLPLSKSIIAVLTIFYGVMHWNDYMTALIYIDEKKLYPLQLILRNILVGCETLATDLMKQDEVILRKMEAEQIKYGLIIVSSVPLLMVYPFLQKYFTQGIMIGSIKG